MIINVTEILKSQTGFPPYSVELDSGKLSGVLTLGNRQDGEAVCSGCLFVEGNKGFPGRLLKCSGIKNGLAELDLGMLEGAEGSTIPIAQEQATNLSNCGLRGLPNGLTALRR